MSERTEPNHDTFALGPGPSRMGAFVDILICFGAGLVFYGIEEVLRSADLFPFPGIFDGGFSLIASFFAVVALMKRRGQRWSDLGLKRPRRWWFIPVWGFLILVVTILSQLTVVPMLSAIVNAPAPDMSRYDVIHRNLPMLLVAMPGAMITGGFMEEFIYRGMMIDRLGRLFGGGRGGIVVAALLCGAPFGLVHFEWGFGGILVTAVMGSVLGLMYLVTRRNLWPLIAAHASLDAVLMLQVYYGVIG